MGQYNVCQQDHDAAHHHRVGACLAHLERTAPDVVAEVGGYRRDDERVDNRLDDGIPDIKLVEVELQPVLERRGRHVGACREAGGYASHDACEHTEDNEHGDKHHQPYNLREDKEVRRVDTHDFHRVYLLRDAHRPYLGGDVAAHLAGKDETHDGRGELQEDNLARSVSDGELGDKRRADVERDLYGNDRTDEDGYDDDDPQRVDTQLVYLPYQLLEEHAPAVGDGQSLPHQHDIFPHLV